MGSSFYIFRFAEAMVLCVFIVIVILWLFRDPPKIDGWGIGFYDAVQYVVT